MSLSLLAIPPPFMEIPSMHPDIAYTIMWQTGFWGGYMPVRGGLLNV